MDELLADNRCEEAEKVLEVLAAPRYTDFWMSIARIYEIIGEYDKAIKSWEQLVTVLKKEWKVLEGEAIDGPQREIERLTKLALALDKC